MARKPTSKPRQKITPEHRRLEQAHLRKRNWQRWGTYLSERQWGTVREDYSADGNAWDYFPHDHARSRAYRWGEDGLLGICDRECRLCFSLALWNEQDAILKERLFGLTNHQGNHGEDVKELYHYLDATPTMSYARGLYRYPQTAFPYDPLVAENGRRDATQPEYELADTGAFDEHRYFDVEVEYAKADADDLLIRVHLTNAGDKPAPLHVLATLWYRNTWSWGCEHEGCWIKPQIRRQDENSVLATHASLEPFLFTFDRASDGNTPQLLFTDNETNVQRLFNSPNANPHVKDAFDRCVVHGEKDAVNPQGVGTKVAGWYRFDLSAGQTVTLQARLRHPEAAKKPAFGPSFASTFTRRRREADAFYASVLHAHETEHQKQVARQAYAGLLWSKQFYHYAVKEWLQGDPAMPPPPPARREGRNHDWPHLFNRGVISMPDKWEYPWYAAWDLAFHMLPMADVDPQFAKDQLILFMREWYMHPNGQLPAYEFALGDVNPPVHAWACWRVFEMGQERGEADFSFLARAFQKLMINFTWWVNRKDEDGHHLFSGGFLGLDNIGVFDRSQPLADGATLRQADGTAWMAFYCMTMLKIALTLARHDNTYEDVASKFFEHFIAIVDAMNCFGGTGLWSQEDGFYYDHMLTPEGDQPMRIRSLVGLIPLLAAGVVDDDFFDAFPGFHRRTQWFMDNRKDLARHIAIFDCPDNAGHRLRLLAIPSRDRMLRLMHYLFDENEFLSPYGIRSLSRYHLEHPFTLEMNGQKLEVRYEPGESTTSLFGGNSNWRGPVWFPLNILIIESLELYHQFYQDRLKVEYPTGSGQQLTLKEIASDLSARLGRLFEPQGDASTPPYMSDSHPLCSDPKWRKHHLFYEYFNGDTGKGLGASHQTGWTAMVTQCLVRAKPD